MTSPLIGHEPATTSCSERIVLPSYSRAQLLRRLPLGDRSPLAGHDLGFSGSMPFAYFHVVFFAVWIAANLGVLHVPAFDPYAFGLLTTIVSLEAIFLSTCVLVSQNRQAVIAERRSELDLQINLLTEYEVTRILMLVDRLAKERNIDTERNLKSWSRISSRRQSSQN
jgi:uncharacterized membrane protein